jgi:hypothetical protein
MPESNDSANAGLISEKAPAEATASTATEQQTETQTASSSSLMERLGLPKEVQKEYAELNPPETEAVAEPAQADEAAAEEPAEQADPEVAPTDWPEHVKKVFDKRIAKMRKQKGTAEERAERAEEIAAQLQAQLDGTQPVTLMPTGGDPLAGVQSEDQLAQVVREARLVSKWCRENAEGFIENEGTENEKVISAKEIAAKLSVAQDVLQFEVPRKQAEFHQRAQYDAIAQKHYPKFFDRGSEEYQLLNGLQLQMPGLVNHPGKHLIFGDYLRGVKARLDEENSKANSNPDIPKELLRQQPPIAPHVPTAPARANGEQPSRKKVDNAMNQAQEEGSREAIVAAIRAAREAAANKTDARSPVLV